MVFFRWVLSWVSTVSLWWPLPRWSPTPVRWSPNVHSHSRRLTVPWTSQTCWASGPPTRCWGRYSWSFAAATMPCVAWSTNSCQIIKYIHGELRSTEFGDQVVMIGRSNCFERRRVTLTLITWATHLVPCSQIFATHLMIGYGSPSSNELHRFDYMTGHQYDSPNNGCQAACPYSSPLNSAISECTYHHSGRNWDYFGGKLWFYSNFRSASKIRYEHFIFICWNMTFTELQGHERDYSDPVWQVQQLWRWLASLVTYVLFA